MDYYCVVCDQTIQFIPKSEHLQSFTRNEFEKYTNKTHYRKSRFFDTDEISNVYITNQNKN